MKKSIYKSKSLQKSLLLSLAFCATTTSAIYAQNVGINTPTPDASSLLDLNSTDRGLLVPRISIGNVAAAAPVTAPATSLLVYNTNAAITGGSGVGFYYWDGAQWAALGKESVDNGLYYNGGANRIRLGGPLVENTVITQGANQMTYNLNGTGDFNVQDNGVTRFQVLDDGRVEMSYNLDASGAANSGVLEIANSLRLDGNEIITNTNAALFLQNDNNGDLRVDATTLAVDASANMVGIGTVTPTYQLDVVGNIGHNQYMYHNDDADTYLQFPAADQMQLRTGNVRMIDMVEGGTDYVVINEGSADVDFRIESNNQANQFFVNGGNDRIGIRTNAPGNFFEMINGGVNVGANSMANFENRGIDGVALGARNTSATSGYNAAEFITDYSGNGFLAAGVMGLALYQGGALSNSIGVRAATNEWQGTGIYASRFNSGGANSGWGGQVYNDLGYTGFFGTISDKRTKKDIQKISGALDIVAQLNPVTYNFDLEKYPLMGLNEEKEYGFIAQEVREVLPEITRTKNFTTNSCQEVIPNKPQVANQETFVAMDYTRIIPILTKAVQEQQEIIKKLEARIDELENK